MALGQNQYHVSIYVTDNNDNTSIAITTDVPVMLSFESPHATTNNLENSCGSSSCNEDFVQFMPIASQPLQCNSYLYPPDQRMCAKDYTTRLHISPPNLGLNCDAISQITVYNNINNMRGNQEVVDKAGFTKIDLINNGVAGFSTIAGQVSTNRLGSAFDENGIIANGHFMHYVPSTREWLTGKSSFYTLAKDCVLEFYADADGSNDELIKINGHTLDTLKYEHTPILFFEQRYSQFVVNINGYGLHTIENHGKYVAYVICKHVNGPYNAHGYLTGSKKGKENLIINYVLINVFW
uniref:PA14 domain-containing protein n=1 Tax=Rhabditophanes sp. KR3021 TaxID=114890 RepID=A0AC35TJ27_9BILA